MSGADRWNISGFVTSLTASSANTVSAYQRDVRLFVDWVERHGIKAPGQVTKAHVRSYIAFLTTSKLARRSIARKKAALARYFGWLSRNGKLKIDPTIGVKTPSDKGRLPKVLTGEQLRALLERHPDEHPRWRHLRDDAVVELLYGSGLRVSELCSLDIDSIDQRRGVVRVMGKGSKERQVPVSKPSVEAVRDWLGVRRVVVDDSDALAIVRKEVKKRQDSVEAFEKGGRPEMAASEKAEIEILNAYLPRQLSAAEVEALVKAAIAEAGATSKKDMGAVMKLVNAKSAGRADGRTLSAEVQKQLPA